MRNQFRTKNHYVPESYLRHWCNSDNKLWYYSLLSPHHDVPFWKPSSQRGIAYHKNLYTRLIAVCESDDIEDWFNIEFENPATIPINKAISNARLTTEDWRKLIKFLAAQDVRTPAKLIKTLKDGQSTLNSVVNEYALRNIMSDYVELKKTDKIKEINAFPNSELLPIKTSINFPVNSAHAELKVEALVGRGLWLFEIKQVLTTTINALFKHKWTILISPENIDWLTTDDPVVKLNYHNFDNYDFNGGWDSLGTEIFMPLSPKYLLYTRIGYKPLIRGTVLTENLALAFQKFIIEHAHRYIFSNKRNSLVPETRPRKICLETFKAEREQWENWHDQNTVAEKNLEVKN